MGLSTSRTVCALVFLASVVISPTVLAHAHLKQQSPAADSVVSAPHKQVVKTGAVTRDEKNKAQLIVPLAQTLATGTYQVDWHVVSVDGHKTKGSYHFSVK